MRTLLVLAGMVFVLAIPFAQPAQAEPALTFDQQQITVMVGDRFTLRSQLANPGGAPTDHLLAHLNVASITNEVYVDPEDWSASRSRQVEPLAPGASSLVTWDLQAVNVGSFDVYVVLLPNSAATAGTGPLVVSPPVKVTVAARPIFDAGGALPVVAAVPVVFGLIVLTVLYRSRRRL